MGLIIRSSSIHAAGCYTTKALRKGERVSEYTGTRLTKDQADEAYEASPITFLFGLGGGEIVIDGHCAAMFINHSCDGNCETSEVRGRVWIKAIKDIPAGAEITYDYCLYDGGDDEAICNCGAKNCRGTMYSEDEVRKRKAAAKKAELKARRKSVKKKQHEKYEGPMADGLPLRSPTHQAKSRLMDGAPGVSSPVGRRSLRTVKKKSTEPKRGKSKKELRRRSA